MLQLDSIEDAIIATLLYGDRLTVPEVLAQQIVGKGTVARACGRVFKVAEPWREDS